MHDTTTPGPKVIHAGLFRTGTKSMSEAYTILGYRSYHALDQATTRIPWSLVEQAAEATWPEVSPDRARGPFSRQDWDALWGRYDVITDLASPFARELIAAYPEAKVVVVQRDFETWWPSFRSQLLDTLFGRYSGIQFWIAANVLRLRAPHAMRKVHLGFFGARDETEIAARARDAYETYYREIRAAVPPERRLEYALGSGWEPLCTFLGVPVPDRPFPRANDRAAHAEHVRRQRKALLTSRAPGRTVRS